MKNQVDYFERVLIIMRELKEDHPNIEISKHYALATDSSNFNITDKELFLALQRHKGELDMNTLSDRDLERVIEETEDLFTEIDPEDEWPVDEDEKFLD